MKFQLVHITCIQTKNARNVRLAYLMYRAQKQKVCNTYVSTKSIMYIMNIKNKNGI